MSSVALSPVWAAPEHNEFGPPAGDGTRRTGNGHTTPSTVLVVEDEILIRMAVSDFLRECGYRVLEASTAEEAQSVFRAGEPVEILFSDIDLGNGMSGFELATWTRENYPAVKILLSSGVARMEEEAKHLCDGPFLQKPYSHTSLADHIRRLLGRLGQQSG